jgi:hypothetical protein
MAAVVDVVGCIWKSFACHLDQFTMIFMLINSEITLSAPA